MRSQNKEEKTKLGHPSLYIDWKKVDELLMAGCSGRQIAGYLGMHEDTLYLRCKKEKKVAFSAYSQEKSSKGESLLAAHQYAKALGLTDKGDNTLLIWLGKTRLKQKEHDVTIIAANDNPLTELIQSVKDLKEKDAPQSKTDQELQRSNETI